MRALSPIRMLFIDLYYSGDARTKKVIQGINEGMDRRLR